MYQMKHKCLKSNQLVGNIHSATQQQKWLCGAGSLFNRGLDGVPEYIASRVVKLKIIIKLTYFQLCTNSSQTLFGLIRSAAIALSFAAISCEVSSVLGVNFHVLAGPLKGGSNIV
jgi:hypothetical protein